MLAEDNSNVLSTVINPTPSSSSSVVTSSEDESSSISTSDISLTAPPTITRSVRRRSSSTRPVRPTSTAVPTDQRPTDVFNEGEKNLLWH